MESNTLNPAVKEFTDTKQIEEIIGKTKTCHVAMVDGDKPYVLGFNFGYENGVIYLHCAKDGKKLDILRKNNNVCVEFQCDLELFFRHEQVACSWRQRYRSVLAYGTASFVSDYQEKVDAMNIFMRNYSDREFKYSEPSIHNILVIKIICNEFTGRSFEY